MRFHSWNHTTPYDNFIRPHAWNRMENKNDIIPCMEFNRSYGFLHGSLMNKDRTGLYVANVQLDTSLPFLFTFQIDTLDQTKVQGWPNVSLKRLLTTKHVNFNKNMLINTFLVIIKQIKVCSIASTRKPFYQLFPHLSCYATCHT